MIDVLKQLVDALENHSAIKHPQQIHYRDAAIEVGKQAIKEFESQEPVAWELGVVNGVVTRRPVARPQRTWVGLASEDRLTAKYMQDAPDGIEAVIDYIEAKLKEKNT